MFALQFSSVIWAVHIRTFLVTHVLSTELYTVLLSALQCSSVNWTAHPQTTSMGCITLHSAVTTDEFFFRPLGGLHTYIFSGTRSSNGIIHNLITRITVSTIISTAHPQTTSMGCITLHHAVTTDEFFLVPHVLGTELYTTHYKQDGCHNIRHVCRTLL